MRLAAHYTAAGGTLSDGQDHLYWRVLDALAFAPDESYLEALFDVYG